MKKPILFLLPNKDISYIRAAGNILGKYCSTVMTSSEKFKTRSEIILLCKQRNVNTVATTSWQIFRMLFPYLEGSENDNRGTVLDLDNTLFPALGKIRVMLINPFQSIYTENSGPFLLDHYLGKLVNGGVLAKPLFDWAFVTPANIDYIELLMGSASLCAVDIETSKEDLRITSVAYSFINGSQCHTYVIKVDHTEFPFCLSAMRILNRTPCPKIMQNGRYDSAYFLRFNAPLINYIYDTYHMQHCLFPELPKTLAFISGMYLENFIFWKDESSKNLYSYNAKDAHNTLWTWIAQIKYIHDNNCQYALKNYLLEFPVVFPCISCGLEGLLTDKEEEQRLKAIAQEKYEVALKSIRTCIGEPHFNPASPLQVGQLMQALGYKHWEDGTEKKAMQKFKETHPLYQRIGELIEACRKNKKAISTYFQIEMLNGRMMYSLDPAGTETGRMASRESNFWCGTQVQNIPMYAKSMYISEPGWTFGAVDKAQSESYCTGYISQDENLINVLLTSPDFHCTNASLFFGIPFDQLYDAVKKKVLNKPIRTVSKRTNHGANYNMAAGVLLETMGTAAVLEAKRLLNLPASYSLLKVCEFLLQRFDATYPRIRNLVDGWYREIVDEVVSTGKLYIESIGWTRRTFLRVTKAKPDLNAAVAHKPQCLSVQLVNKAFVRIWRELQLGKYRGQFRLKAQVHDEILFIAKDEIIDEALQEVADMMVIPLQITGRVMSIPSTTAKGKTWAECKD